MSYSEFLDRKTNSGIAVGFEPDESLYPPQMFPHQRLSTTWACKMGRSALFLGTGLGKTICQLAWSHQVVNHTNKPVLILAPLAVNTQTAEEGARFCVPAFTAESQADIKGPGVYITNYEKLHHFDPSKFSGVVLDESSILKGFDGKTRKTLTDSFVATPYKLSCTATPSPNDYIELGTQSQFLGVMSQHHMLAVFFIHDTNTTKSWRLKRHAENGFWEWLSTWAIFMQSPSDVGLDGTDYVLPELIYHNIVVETTPIDSLFVEPAMSLIDRNRARKNSMSDRCKKAASIANEMDTPVMIWCNLNAESKLLASLINESVEVCGADTPDHKSRSLLDFCNGKTKALISKPKIAGFGLNMQRSHHCIFVGLSDSWESLYQAIRRQWRFGQMNRVHAYLISADTEGAVLNNIRRKDKQHKILSAKMMKKMSRLTTSNISATSPDKTIYSGTNEITLPQWIIQS